MELLRKKTPPRILPNGHLDLGPVNSPGFIGYAGNKNTKKGKKPKQREKREEGEKRGEERERGRERKLTVSK